MTREEVIRELKQFSGTTRLRLSANFWEALNRAIKLLEQESCDDAISRQATIDAILKIHPIDTEYDCTLYDKIDVMYVLKDLPPVNPQESKARHWIPCSEMMPNESGKYWCTFGGTNLMGIDFYTTESYAKKWFDEPEEYIGWESKNVSAWMPLPEPYRAEMESGVCKGCHYNDGEVHAECVVCDKAEMEGEE